MLTTELSRGDCSRCFTNGPVIRLRFGSLGTSVAACPECAVVLGRTIEKALLRLPPDSLPEQTAENTHKAILQIQEFAGLPIEGN